MEYQTKNLLGWFYIYIYIVCLSVSLLGKIAHASCIQWGGGVSPSDHQKTAFLDTATSNKYTFFMIFAFFSLLVENVYKDMIR